MSDEVIRITNVAMLLKIETTEGVDAAPGAVDAFPFEKDGYTYNLPFVSEESNEATGDMIAGAPLIVGQPARVSIRVRLKGANAAYTSSVKPPHHALLAIAGLRPLFTAAVVAGALTAGTTTSATLANTFSATTRAYLGMPLILSGAEAGAVPLITEYTSGRVATLADEFSAELDETTSAAIPANYTYAGTSPNDGADRITDNPSGTLYLYEDGTLHKFFACRAMLDELTANSSKPGFATFQLVGIYGGKFDASIPDGISLPAHSAPTLVKGLAGVSDAFSVNRRKLPISTFSYKMAADLDSPEDPNTPQGYGAGVIGGRVPSITCDPLSTLVATRDTLGQMEAGSQYPGAVRFKGAASNRMSITFPKLQMSENQPGTRQKLRSDQLGYRALNSGRDAQDRATDVIICFY
ncbi:hypothetical protein HY78_14520 [Rhizorhabdus wittichii DC-6]|nr:hypothetical protein HY78_14520 [Rhizorhabdus wittichii DC-6]